MSAESVKSLLAARMQTQNAAEAGGEEYTPFASGRVGNRPQVMVTFEKATGEMLTLAYSHLYSIKSTNPNAGFSVQFSEDIVEVHGRNLERILDLLATHKLRNVKEPLGGAEFDVGPQASTPIVTKIVFRPIQAFGGRG